MKLWPRASITEETPQNPRGGTTAFSGLEPEMLKIRLQDAAALLSMHFTAAKQDVDGYLKECDRHAAEIAFRRVLDLNDMQRALKALADELDGTAPPLYLVSSMFLMDSFRYLFKESPANACKDLEDIHYVTGGEYGRLRVLERLVTFEKAERSSWHVAGDQNSTHDALIQLQEKGHRLIAWVHSHIFRGEGGTIPSTKDFNHQERLERGRYPAIGAIFSLDGYLRFFSKNVPFTVHVFGKGVKKINEQLYLLQVDQHPDQTSSLVRSL